MAFFLGAVYWVTYVMVTYGHLALPLALLACVGLAVILAAGSTIARPRQPRRVRIRKKSCAAAPEELAVGHHLNDVFRGHQVSGCAEPRA